MAWHQSRASTSYAAIILAFILTAIVLSGMMFGQGFWGNEQPAAVAGVLDLSENQFDADSRPVVLKGDWLLKWHGTNGCSSDLKAGQALTVAVPGLWNDGNELPAQGCGTYQLRIKVADSQKQTYALRIPAFSNAYALHVNGKHQLTMGVVSTDQYQSIPGYQSQIAVFESEGSQIDLEITVANDVHSRGGLRKPIEFGSVDQVSRHYLSVIGVDLMLIGGLLMMGLYHLLLFVVHRKELSMLYFGLFCLTIGIRMSLLGETVITKLLPGLAWLTAIKMEYIVTIISVIVYFLFISSLFVLDRYRYANVIFSTAGCILMGMVALASPTAFTWFIIPLQMHLVLGVMYVQGLIMIALMRKREGSIIAFLASGAYIVMVLNDVLFAQGLLHTSERMSGLGLLLFILFNSVLLANRLSRAFINEEKLSAQLSKLNASLHDIIQKRTADLEKANLALKLKNKEMSRLETSRSHLLSNISHDLGTPLTTIQCYLEAILDGMADTEEQHNRYLHIIHSKVISMGRLLEDLFQLTQLEARQVTFKMEPIRSNELIRLLFSRYELDARNASLTYTLKVQKLGREERPYSIIKGDVERLHQVFSNLIFNGIKFTPSFGSIHVEMVDDGKRMLCRITDNGQGIRPEDKPYIFDRFYTASKSRSTTYNEKGLGLSISKEIIESHGGQIWLEWTEVGVGSTFCFMLPTCAAD